MISPNAEELCKIIGTWASRKLKYLQDIAGCARGITNKDKKDCKDGKDDGNNDNKRLSAPWSLELS